MGTDWAKQAWRIAAAISAEEAGEPEWVCDAIEKASPAAANIAEHRSLTLEEAAEIITRAR